MVKLSMWLPNTMDTKRCTWIDASGQFHSPATLPLEIKPTDGVSLVMAR
jgi:hypothetical protein